MAERPAGTPGFPPASHGRMAKKTAKKKTRKTAKKGSRKASSGRGKSTKSTSTRGPKNGGRDGLPPWADDFLEALADKGHVGQAAAAVGLERSRPYKVRFENPEFAKLWATAHRQGKIARLEELADNSLERATHGYPEILRDGEGKPILDPKGQEIVLRRTFFTSMEKFHLQMGLPRHFNLSPGDTTGGIGGVTPEQQAAKVRAVLAALDNSVPKP